ncbi:MAG: type II/IV secretion system protein [Planctomycetes bacterium]|nr:type II/IV secretion system protein [Planctomycetota bacterium]
MSASAGTSSSATGLPGEIANLWSRILLDAVTRRASDIHFNGLAEGVLLRYRVNGMLHDIETLAAGTGRRLIQHLKAVSGMNLIERRRPQDGRVLIAVGEGEVDLRLATIHTLWGENLAIRVFDKRSPLRCLKDLGLHAEGYQLLYDLIHSPQGLFLVTGPTGAGKTTSLYAILNQINRPEINIITVEDPVEHDIPRVNQIGVQPEIGIGFNECLRSSFRQDPDVLMIGEIRDTEGAWIAIRAALSGHLVLSTLHTGSAAEAITALINLGTEPFYLASALIGVMAQQLIRTLCTHCRYEVPFEVSPEQLDPAFRAEFLKMGELGKPLRYYFGQGCDQCFRSGYRDRTGLFEILRVTPAVRKLILQKAPAGEIDQAAKDEGMIGLRTLGIRLVIQGKTTVEEVLRVVPVPEEEMAGVGL